MTLPKTHTAVPFPDLSLKIKLACRHVVPNDITDVAPLDLPEPN